MRVLYVASRFPWPATGGRENMILQSLRTLSSSADVDFMYYENHDTDRGLIPGFEKSCSVKCVGRLPVRNAIVCALYAFFCSDHAIQTLMFSSARAIDLFKQQINSTKYDVVVLDMLRLSALRSFIPDGVKTVLEMDDLLSRRYSVQAESGSAVNPLGSRSHGFSGRIALLSSGSMRRHFVSREARILKNIELNAPFVYDIVTLTSPIEADELSRLTLAKNVISYPPSMNLDFPEVSTQESYASVESVNIGFMGNLAVAHNEASLNLIITNVLSSAVNFPTRKYKFYIFGKLPAGFLRATCPAPNVSIEYLGFIADLDEAFKKISVFLCPILFGSGIKLKILDAMRYGLPVVTNSIGIEGIPVSEKYFDAAIRDEPLEIFNALNNLADDFSLRQQLADEGRLVLSKFFSFDKNSKKYLDVIGLLK